MAKVECAGLGLDDDEIDLIKKRRAQRKEEEDQEVWVKDEHGREVKLPYGRARNWLRKYGFELDDEDPEAEPEPEPDEDEDKDKPKAVRFGGRRIG